jgi:anti-anti-sigma factor
MAEFERSDDGLVVEGPLDIEAAPKLGRHLKVLLDSDAEVLTLDLSKVKYISSICVGSLVAFWVDLRPAGRRMKVAPSPAVRKVFDMVGLSGVFAKAASVRKPPPAPEKPTAKHADFDDDESAGGDAPADWDSAGGDV